MLVDLASPDESRWMVTPGQSGNPFSPHWGDLMRPWRDFAWLSFKAPPVETLVLAPR
jgi:acyl-homoserine lactone acylase PvdQ